MPLTLVETAGSPSANSYATVAEAEAYHETRLHSSTWNVGTETPAKTQALIWSTRLLDQHFEWFGRIASSTQALRWPRAGAYDRDGRLLSSSTIPTDVKNATAELARLLIDGDRSGDASADASAITGLKLGSLEIDYAGDGATVSTDVIPSAVVAMLANLGTYKDAPGTGGAISLMRG
jgi:hypothetical protein